MITPDKTSTALPVSRRPLELLPFFARFRRGVHGVANNGKGVDVLIRRADLKQRALYEAIVRTGGWANGKFLSTPSTPSSDGAAAWRLSGYYVAILCKRAAEALIQRQGLSPLLRSREDQMSRLQTTLIVRGVVPSPDFAVPSRLRDQVTVARNVQHLTQIEPRQPHGVHHCQLIS